ncbi:MAG: hypothetical protein K2H43_06715, partial [Clostridia bacterium]|nr:hypothetical protein [Clostridia bacterium]
DNLEEFVPPEASEQNPKARAQESEKVLWLDARKLTEEDFSELIETLEGYAGETKTKILHGGKRFEYSVNMSRAFLAEIRTFLAEECVKFL